VSSLAAAAAASTGVLHHTCALLYRATDATDERRLTRPWLVYTATKL